MHNRTALRRHLVTELSNAGLSVLSERRQRIDTTLRPLVIVSLGEDVTEPPNSAMGSPSMDVEHTQECTMELHADGDSGDTVADALDALELQVEAILALDTTLGGLCLIIRPQTSTLEMNADTDRVVGVRTLTYSIEWRSAFGSPDNPE